MKVIIIPLCGGIAEGTNKTAMLEYEPKWYKYSRSILNVGGLILLENRVEGDANRMSSV